MGVIRYEFVTRVLVDAGPLVALCNARDQFHDECVDTLYRIGLPMLTSWLVIAEAAHLLRTSSSAVEQLMGGPANGLYRIAPLSEQELPQMAELLRKYRKLGPQVSDVSLVHLAGRESIDTVFTLDRRDFSVYRTAAGKRLRILPELA